MKILVLGAGVIGVTTAWYLSRAGFQVEVIDRRDSPGMEASFANGGQVSPCHAEPWANPETPAKVLKWLGKDDAPLHFHWNHRDIDLWSWGARFLMNCRDSKSRANMKQALRIALYSRSCLKNLRSETGIRYDRRGEGILHIYRDHSEFAKARETAGQMTRYGLNRQVKSVNEALGIEPALENIKKEMAGAIYTPDDESGDAYKFTNNLARLCRKVGVVFRYNCHVHGFEWGSGKISAVTTSQGRFTGDAYVLAMGCWSPTLSRQVGINLPIYPAKGYSITVAIKDGGIAPSVSITDDENKLVFSRLGNKMRCAGTAEFDGWNQEITTKRGEAFIRKVSQIFPDIGDYSDSNIWAGLRPVTPDSIPVLGASRIPNLFLNTGHGTLGWTMCCGSAKLLTDIISRRPTDIDVGGFSARRFFYLADWLTWGGHYNG